MSLVHISGLLTLSTSSSPLIRTRALANVKTLTSERVRCRIRNIVSCCVASNTGNPMFGMECSRAQTRVFHFFPIVATHFSPSRSCPLFDGGEIRWLFGFGVSEYTAVRSGVRCSTANPMGSCGNKVPHSNQNISTAPSFRRLASARGWEIVRASPPLGCVGANRPGAMLFALSRTGPAAPTERKGTPTTASDLLLPNHRPQSHAGSPKRAEKMSRIVVQDSGSRAWKGWNKTTNKKKAQQQIFELAKGGASVGFVVLLGRS